MLPRKSRDQEINEQTLGNGDHPGEASLLPLDKTQSLGLAQGIDIHTRIEINGVSRG